MGVLKDMLQNVPFRLCFRKIQVLIKKCKILKYIFFRIQEISDQLVVSTNVKKVP